MYEVVWYTFYYMPDVISDITHKLFLYLPHVFIQNLNLVMFKIIY